MRVSRRLSLRSSPVAPTLAGVACVLSTVICACGHPPADDFLARARALGAGRIAGQNIRELATNKPMPRYPRRSVAEGASGVAVAEVLVDRDGSMERVRILQAPDASIARATEEALRQWVFTRVTPPTHREGLALWSKLIFYFEIENGVGRVRIPEHVERGRRRQGFTTVSTQTFEEISEPALTELLRHEASDDLIVLDIRERHEFANRHREDAVNIPANEVAARAPREFSPSSHVVVECISDLEPVCEWVAEELANSGFAKVSLLVGERLP